MKARMKVVVRGVTYCLLLSCLLCSCVEEYWPELEEVHDGSIVVDGRISNVPGSYSVKLSNAISFDQETVVPVTGASVYIIDNEGNRESLFEELPGSYVTTDPNFVGIIGRSYKVEINLPSGKSYESAFEELMAPIGIESVGFEEDDVIIDETLGTTQKGYQFSITTEESANDKNYFYWELIETYEYHADYKIQYYFEGLRDFLSQGPENLPAATEFHKTLYECWATDTVKQFFSFGTDQLNVTKIENQPLHFMAYDNKKLEFGYSLLAHQFTISESAYLFIKGLQEQNSTTGEFYTSQPYQIVGNIKNVNDDNEVALGYFMVVGAAEPERIFTRKPPGSVVPDNNYEVTCGVATYNNEYVARLTNLISRSGPENWPIFVGQILVAQGEGVLNLVPTWAALSYSCVDCRRQGGVKDKPSFWIDF